MVVGCWYGGRIAKRLDYNLAHGRSDIKLTEVCRKALKDFWVVRFCLQKKLAIVRYWASRSGLGRRLPCRSVR